MGFPTVCAGNRKLNKITRGRINTCREPHGGCSSEKPIIWAIPKPKEAETVLELSVPYYHRPCACNEKVSLYNRVLSPPYQPNPKGVAVIKRATRCLIKFARKNQVACLSWRTFVASIAIPGKRKLYERALACLEKEGFQDWMGNLSSFLKVEPQCGISKGSADPRMIQARTPEFNIVFGAFYKPIEHLILTLDWSEVFPWAPSTRQIAKGLNNVQRGRLLLKKWKKFRQPVAFDFDASRFDQSVSPEFLAMCHAFYLALHNKSPLLAKLLKKQLQNAGLTKGGFQYYGEGGRASGDQDTGGGNSLITVVMVNMFFRTMKINYEFVCDGDDGLIFIDAVNAPIMDGFADFCRALGFKMEVGKPVHRFEEVDFCQCRPVEITHGKWVMIRKPARAISRLGMSHTSMSTIQEALYTTWAIGSCELSLNRGIPVMQEVALWALRNGVKPSKRFLQRKQYSEYRYWELPKIEEHTPLKITTEARVSFALAFGVSIGEQLILEAAFRKHTFRLVGRVIAPEPHDAGAGPVYCSSHHVYV